MCTGMGRYSVLKRDLRCPELDDVLDRVVSEEGWVGHDTLLLILAVEGADSLSAAKIDEAMWGLARVLENVGEQGGNEAVEELLRGRVAVVARLNVDFLELLLYCM